MDPAWHIAVAPTPHTCLRLRLEPLTLGHVFLLREYGVEFEQPGFKDLIVGVFICSSPHATSRKHLRRWWAKHFMAFLGFLCRKIDLFGEARKFSRYMTEGMACPMMHRFSNGPARLLKAPEEWRLLTMLEEAFHKSKKEALDLTMAEAHCRWAAHADKLGTAQLMTDDEREFWQYARRMDLEKSISRSE